MPKYVQIYDQIANWNDNYLHYPATENGRYAYVWAGLGAGPYWTVSFRETSTPAFDDNYFLYAILTTTAEISPVVEHDSGYPATALPSAGRYAAPYNPSAAFGNGQVHLLFHQAIEYSGTNSYYNHGRHMLWKSSTGFDSSSKQFNFGEPFIFSYKSKLHVISRINSRLYIMTLDNLSQRLELPSSNTAVDTPSVVEWGTQFFVFARSNDNRLRRYVLTYSLEAGWKSENVFQSAFNDFTLNSVSCTTHTEKSNKAQLIYCAFLTTGNQLRYRTYFSNNGVLTMNTELWTVGGSDGASRVFSPTLIDIKGQLWLFSVRESDKALIASVYDGPYPFTIIIYF